MCKVMDALEIWMYKVMGALKIWMYKVMDPCTGYMDV